ncbi:MAG TPA: family 43 glycosylhydrolase [Firmicutes bacterium]|nr:family 43 glycosylhydrolase [Bacillota bacterium]
MLKKSDIHMRDPFVLPIAQQGKYYLYGTTDENCWVGPFVGFDVFESEDLENWAGPFAAFRPPEGFWADRNFWAPEVFRYQGKYFMFASFKAEGVCRGTQILVADDPKGPFLPHSDGPVTPRDWECLDGTFYVDQNQHPWMIFCHEWVQAVDGEIHAVRLSDDLQTAVGDPVLLFRASEAPWVQSRKRSFNGVEKDGYVTDGPFIYRASDGNLLMLWSSIGANGYTMGIAKSTTGSIVGPWLQIPKPIFEKDGGHGMIFKTFDNKLMITVHTPNKTPYERPMFLEVQEKDGTLELVKAGDRT